MYDPNFRGALAKIAVHGYQENPICPSKFKKGSKRTDKLRMDLANKMAYVANDISPLDYLYMPNRRTLIITSHVIIIVSFIISFYNDNLETESDTMLHSLALANLSHEIISILHMMINSQLLMLILRYT